MNYKKNELKIDPSKETSPELSLDRPKTLRELQKDWLLSDLTQPELTVSEYRGEPQTTLVLPTFAGKKPITRVGNHCDWLRTDELIIPEGYTVIEEGALMNKRAPRIVHMTDSVIELGVKAFYGAVKLEEIRLSDRLTRIEDRTFQGCISLSKVNMPSDLTFIGKAAFKQCSNLDSLEIREKVVEIGKEAFSECPKLVIYAPKGSYAIEYAIKNGIKYVEV